MVASVIGWIDVHLLGSSVLGRSQLWTRDVRLGAAEKHGRSDANRACAELGLPISRG